MKRLIIIVILFTIPIYLNGQTKLPLPIVDNKIIFTEVVMVDNIQKDQLYSRTKLWFADNFKSTKDVIQLDDKENGIVLGKGKLQINVSQENKPLIMTLRITVKIELKDDKYKVDIYDIQIQGVVPDGFEPSAVYINIEEALFNPRFYNDPDEILFVNKLFQICNSLLSGIKKSLTDF